MKISLKEETQLKNIKKLAIIALFSDKEITDLFVLKGGNLLDIIYDISLRSSIDLDISIEEDISKKELDRIIFRIKNTLTKTFNKAGYKLFDFSFKEKPKTISPTLKDFWGGYIIEFKLIETARFNKYKSHIDALRRNATIISNNQKRKFRIEISKFEYCRNKQKRELEGLTVYVYSPIMIIFEKLRAICQQMAEYNSVVRTHRKTARARDFLDIYSVFTSFKINLSSKESTDLLKNIFAAKKVPLHYLDKLEKYRDFHRQDFDSVKATVKAGIKLHHFDFYFDYVLIKCKELKSIGVI